MKRAWTAALSLCLLLSLAACGGGDAQRAPAASVQSGEDPAGTEAVETGSGEAGNREAGNGESGNAGTGASGTENTAVVDGVSIQAVLDANQTEKLVSSRGSFLMETSYAPEIDTTGQFTEIYADGENVYLKTDATQELYTDHGVYLFMDGCFGAPLMPELPKRSDFSMIVLDEETTSREEITAVEQDGDRITVRTVLSADAISDIFGQDLESTGYAPGDSTEETYTLDASDLALLACSSVLRHEDGSAQDIGTMKITCGAEMPEDAAILREHLDAPERRTMTIVLDPDTEEETWYSTTVQKGDSAFAFLPEGYYVLYKDPACTEEYTPNPEGITEDTVVYSRAMEIPSTLEPDDLANLADAGEGDDSELYDGASHRHAEDAERDMLEAQAAADGNP